MALSFEAKKMESQSSSQLIILRQSMDHDRIRIIISVYLLSPPASTQKIKMGFHIDRALCILYSVDA